MQNTSIIRRLSNGGLAVAIASAITACSAGQTGAPPITSVTNVTSPSYAKLQFAVGTANVYGTETGLNVVSTYRQSNGLSATGVNTPSITGPFTFAATAVAGGGPDPYSTIPGNGPSLTETTGSAPGLTGTPQTVHPGTPACDSSTAVGSFVVCPSGIPPNTTTFGQSGGVFAMGLAPYNSVANSGQAYSYAPYAQPMLDDTDSVTPPQFVPWGGPPAFDPRSDNMGLRDGLGVTGSDSFGDPYFLGIGEGITAFGGVTPGAGAYTLTVSIATNTTGTVKTQSVSQSATLSSLTVLPTLTAPAVTPDVSGDGGAAVNVAALPGPISEAIVQIVDWGPGGGPEVTNPSTGKPPYYTPNCQGGLGTSFAPVYYTLEVTAAGTVNLPATDGPNSNTTGGVKALTPSPSICTAAQNSAAGATAAADNFTVQIIGFDYPAYEAALSLIQGQETPTIAGAGGQADITISHPADYSWTAGAYTVTTL